MPLILLLLRLLIIILYSKSSAIPESQLGFQEESMTYAMENPMINPQPYPIINTFQLSSLRNVKSLASSSTNVVLFVSNVQLLPQPPETGNPPNLSLPSCNIFFSNVSNWFPFGMHPSRWLYERFKTARDVRETSCFGISP